MAMACVKLHLGKYQMGIGGAVRLMRTLTKKTPPLLGGKQERRTNLIFPTGQVGLARPS